MMQTRVKNLHLSRLRRAEVRKAAAFHRSESEEMDEKHGGKVMEIILRYLLLIPRRRKAVEIFRNADSLSTNMKLTLV